MSEQSYHKLLKSTFENALLHLYFKVSASQSFVKEVQRNKILIDFLKPKLREQRYSLIKKAKNRLLNEKQIWVNRETLKWDCSTI